VRGENRRDTKLLGKHFPEADRIVPLPAQASDRRFYRLHFRRYSRVAMVFPRPAPDRVAQIQTLERIYRAHDLPVPRTLRTIDQRLLIQEDLGDEHLDRFYLRLSSREKERWWDRLIDLLLRLKTIPCRHGTEVLDTSRMQWEMNFCVTHFLPYFFPALSLEQARNSLTGLVEEIRHIDRFAHRDFHSQNILIHRDRLWLVDFQNSLQAPRCYDLASLCFDSYLDTGPQHPRVMKKLKSAGYDLDEDQFHLTALQRNFKALGTFGYQIRVNRNPRYRKYIDKTLADIRRNPRFRQLNLPL